MISIVCVYNDKYILDDYLKKSLENQNVDYELIVVDSIKEAFKSAAQSLNYGARKAKGKYIMFAHQDVKFIANSWLLDAEKWLDSIDNLGIAGVAGMSEIGKSNKNRGRNIIEHGEPARLWSWGSLIKKPEIVQTLDECLIFIPRDIFDIFEFDEDTCDDWHLYAVDYCLTVKEHNYDAYAIPMYIYHKSSGKVTNNYFSTLKKVLKKHKAHCNHIYTTCGDWYTSYPLVLQRAFIYCRNIFGNLFTGETNE